MLLGRLLVLLVLMLLVLLVLMLLVLMLLIICFSQRSNSRSSLRSWSWDGF
jgi:hypothetical protein